MVVDAIVVVLIYPVTVVLVGAQATTHLEIKVRALQIRAMVVVITMEGGPEAAPVLGLWVEMLLVLLEATVVLVY
jgi:hypothetical protein